MERFFDQLAHLGPVIADENVGRHVERGADAKKIIEANRVGAVLDRLVVIDVPATLVLGTPAIAVVGKAALL